MKKTLSVLALAAASMFSSAAMAQAYVGGAVGTGHVNLDCDGATSCDNDSTAFKVLGGYNFGNGLAAELGYISFGKATASDAGLSAEAKATGLMLGVAFHAPLANDFGLTGRLGMINMKTVPVISVFMKTEITGTVAGVGSASDSETNIKPYFGFAVTYAVAKNLKLEAGADFSRAEYDGEDASVRTLTAGLRFDF
jgi:OOP family OmpA-OmpF porin